MTSSSIIVIGAGGHAAVVVDILERIGGYNVAVCELDEALAGGRLLGHPVEAFAAQAADTPMVIAVGDNRARWRIAGEHPTRLIASAIIHPSAVVSPHARIGSGTVVMAGALVNPRATIGAHTIINTGASVDHDCTVGDAAHVSPGAHLAGGVTVGARSHIGIGASIIPFITIGADAVVGAGAVVIADVPDGVVVAGNPARVLRSC